MSVEMILFMLLGFLGIMFLIGSNISQSSNEEQRRKSEELDNKIKLQPFILAAKNIHPNYNLKLFDRIAVLEGPLVNSNNKKIGKIEINGLRSLSYSSNEPYYLVTVGIMIDEKRYELRKEHVQENFEILNIVISDLLKEVMKNQDLQKRIIATTY
jgi:hypothetical protein